MANIQHTSGSTTIHLDGECDTTPEETHAQAVARMIESENSLCEQVGYLGQNDSRTIVIHTHEARCRLEYDDKGVLLVAKVNSRPVWTRGA